MNRLLWGVGTTSAVVGYSLTGVVHAAAPRDASNSSKPVFAPVYDADSESKSTNLPGTILPSRQDNSSKLAQAQSEIAAKLEVDEIESQGRVFKVSKALQGYVEQVRQLADEKLSRLDFKSSELAHKYREGERQAVNTVANLKSDKEDILPSAIYILVTGLGGSILTRRRNILLRATVPWLFGGAAFAYFLPHTWFNVRQLAWKYEQEQVPTLARKHAEAQENLGELKNQTVQLYGDSEKQLKGSVKSLREKVRKWTGY